MELALAAILAGALDPIKIAIALLGALALHKHYWPVVCLAGLMLVVYVVGAGLILRMSNAQLITHLVSGALLIAGMFVSTWFWGTTKTALAGAAVFCGAIGLVLFVSQNDLHRNDTAEYRGGTSNFTANVGAAFAPAWTVARMFSHGENIAVGFGKEVARKVTFPADAEWTNAAVTDWLSEQSDIAPTDRQPYFGTGSSDEAEALRYAVVMDEHARKVNEFRR